MRGRPSSDSAIICAIITGGLFLTVGIPLIFIFAFHDPKDPNFTVESTTVKAYSLTPENQLFCIVNIGLRAHNPNLKKHTFGFAGIDMEMRKGKHHKLADDALPRFNVGPGGSVVVGVEAVGLRVGLKKRIAEEVRADVAAREGRVNLYLRGRVGSDDLRVMCTNVVVDFSRSTLRVNQTVKCGVSVISSD